MKPRWKFYSQENPARTPLVFPPGTELPWISVDGEEYARELLDEFWHEPFSEWMLEEEPIWCVVALVDGAIRIHFSKFKEILSSLMPTDLVPVRGVTATPEELVSAYAIAHASHTRLRSLYGPERRLWIMSTLSGEGLDAIDGRVITLPFRRASQDF